MFDLLMPLLKICKHDVLIDRFKSYFESTVCPAVISVCLCLQQIGDRTPPWKRPAMRGFYSKLDSSSLGKAMPLNLAVETEKAQALLQTFSTASLLASAGLGAFCFLADPFLTLPFIQHHLWLRAVLDNAVHGIIGLWSWAIIIGLRKKSDFYEVVLAGFLASIIDLDHFYTAGSLSLKVRPFHLLFN